MTTRSTNQRDKRSLQAKLFRSHLGVMVLAVLILILAGTIVGFFVSGISPRKGHNSATEGLFLVMVAGLTSAGLAAWIMARAAARRISEPIQSIADATRRMAQGNYTVRVPSGDSTEIAELARDVNSLAAELEHTEERRLRLIGDVAHELRTPLQTIEGSMEALMDGVVQPTDEVFAAIADEAARLKRLAFDLSTLSRVEDGPRIDLRPVELAAQVNDVVDLLQHQFDAKGVRLQLAIELPLEISADPDRIAQILTNVIGNALAFTDEGGTVSVQVLGDGPWAVVRITDTGRGIAEADLEHIFERFFRIDDGSSTGTGVGLTIARSLARAHGGDIIASSPGLGQGSVFELRLPVD
jgi:signal transduction histidine kinase